MEFPNNRHCLFDILSLKPRLVRAAFCLVPFSDFRGHCPRLDQNCHMRKIQLNEVLHYDSLPIAFFCKCIVVNIVWPFIGCISNLPCRRKRNGPFVLSLTNGPLLCLFATCCLVRRKRRCTPLRRRIPSEWARAVR